MLESSIDPPPRCWYKNVTDQMKPYFQGHFPEIACNAGGVADRAMAQVGGVMLLFPSLKIWARSPFLLAVENAKFRKPVMPGDTLVIEC